MIDGLLKEVKSTQIELRRRDFDFDVKLGDHGFECVVLRGAFDICKHAILLLRHAFAVETTGADGLAKPVWHFLAEKLGVPTRGVDMLSDIEHVMEHDPESFGELHEIRTALIDFDIEPGRTRIASMAENLKRRLEDTPLQQRTRKQALALVQAKLLLDGFASPAHTVAATHQRLTKLQAMIDYLPEEAQVARLELFHRGFDFETSLSTGKLTCHVHGGRFVPEKHAHLLSRYVVVVDACGHAPLARPAWGLLAEALGVVTSEDGVLSDIARFIENHLEEFAANHHFKIALTTLGEGPARARVASMAQGILHRLAGIQQRSRNQTRALIQAKLLLGSFTDIFHELFKNDPIAACSVARTLAYRHHEGASAARRAAILLAADVAWPLIIAETGPGTPLDQPSKDRLDALYSAVKPLLAALSYRLEGALEVLFSMPRSLHATDDGLLNLVEIFARAQPSNADEKDLLEQLRAALFKIFMEH